jgi:hypothetical protein
LYNAFDRIKNTNKGPVMDFETVNAFVTLFNRLSTEDQDAILALLKNENPPPPPLGRAWVEIPKTPQALKKTFDLDAETLSRSELVDYCKRIEFCYQEHHSHQGRKPFIPWSMTASLVTDIQEDLGADVLRDYVQHLEATFAKGEWNGFSRPERMRQHFIAWNENKATHPTQ